MSIILCRYGELAIKGANREQFERCLRSNIRTMLVAAKIPAEISRKRGRTFVTVADADCAAAVIVLRRVFGLTSVSPTVPAALTYPEIEATAVRLLTGKSFSTFAIRAQRLQKIFDQTPVLQQKLGAFVAVEFGKQVDLTNPDISLGIEIIDRAYLFTERLSAPGGLPAGIEGTVLALVESDADMLAAWLVMKRGCAVIPMQRKEYPTALLIAYGCTAPTVRINHLNNLARLASTHRAEAMVTGESFDAQSYQSALSVLRPLVGYTTPQIKEKIEELCTPLSKK